MATFTFEALLEKPGAAGTWTYFVIPFNVTQAFGSAGQIAVRGTINGHPYRSSAMPRGDGQHYMVVNKTIRDAIKVTAGSTVDVVMEPDPDARTVEIPADLDAVLRTVPEALTAFKQMSYSHHKEYVEWIEASKTQTTRQKRIAAAVEKILQGSYLKGSVKR